MATFEKTALDGVLLVTPQVFEDHRGFYVETYNEAEYGKNGIDAKFRQDDISVSYKNVLRGIHGDQETAKLVSCLQGRFYLLVVNNDPDSPQYRQWTSFMLSAENRKQVFIPAKFGNGHLVLSDCAIFHYKQTTYYNQKGQFTLRWNEPGYDFWWPIGCPVLSRRDEVGHL